MIQELLPEPKERFKHQKSLATSRMSQVNIVLDVGLQRRLAKKIISTRLAAVPPAVRLFLREAQITAQLDHPSIVPVHEVGRDERDQLFFTMKLVEGQTFAEWVEAQGPQSPGRPPTEVQTASPIPELLEIMIKLCDAMAFAHDRGVIHGDIKPANVMIGAYGAVYLMDWGLARLKDRALTQTSEALRDPETQVRGGTPAFMAPEQARGKLIDERADLFGLGSLIYFALTGTAPYRGSNAAENVLLAREGRFEPLNKHPRGTAVPIALARIVAKAMAFDPIERYASAAELGAVLRAHLRSGAEFPQLEVAAGTHIIRQGEIGDEVFILESGRARVYQEIHGELLERGVMGPGSVFGEMAILVSSPRTASVVALEDCLLRIVTGDILEREVHGAKPWMAALIRSLAQRLIRREAEDAAK